MFDSLNEKPRALIIDFLMVCFSSFFLLSLIVFLSLTAYSAATALSYDAFGHLILQDSSLGIWNSSRKFLEPIGNASLNLQKEMILSGPRASLDQPIDCENFFYFPDNRALCLFSSGPLKACLINQTSSEDFQPITAASSFGEDDFLPFYSSSLWQCADPQPLFPPQVWSVDALTPPAWLFSLNNFFFSRQDFQFSFFFEPSGVLFIKGNSRTGQKNLTAFIPEGSGHFLEILEDSGAVAKALSFYAMNSSFLYGFSSDNTMMFHLALFSDSQRSIPFSLESLPASAIQGFVVSWPIFLPSLLSQAPMKILGPFLSSPLSSPTSWIVQDLDTNSVFLLNNSFFSPLVALSCFVSAGISDMKNLRLSMNSSSLLVAFSHFLQEIPIQSLLHPRRALLVDNNQTEYFSCSNKDAATDESSLLVTASDNSFRYISYSLSSSTAARLNKSFQSFRLPSLQPRRFQRLNDSFYLADPSGLYRIRRQGNSASLIEEVENSTLQGDSDAFYCYLDSYGGFLYSERLNDSSFVLRLAQLESFGMRKLNFSLPFDFRQNSYYFMTSNADFLSLRHFLLDFPPAPPVPLLFYCTNDIDGLMVLDSSGVSKPLFNNRLAFCQCGACEFVALPNGTLFVMNLEWKMYRIELQKNSSGGPALATAVLVLDLSASANCLPASLSIFSFEPHLGQFVIVYSCIYSTFVLRPSTIFFVSLEFSVLKTLVLKTVNFLGSIPGLSYSGDSLMAMLYKQTYQYNRNNVFTAISFTYTVDLLEGTVKRLPLPYRTRLGIGGSSVYNPEKVFSRRQPDGSARLLFLYDVYPFLAEARLSNNQQSKSIKFLSTIYHDLNETLDDSLIFIRLVEDPASDFPLLLFQFSTGTGRFLLFNLSSGNEIFLPMTNRLAGRLEFFTGGLLNEEYCAAMKWNIICFHRAIEKNSSIISPVIHTFSSTPFIFPLGSSGLLLASDSEGISCFHRFSSEFRHLLLVHSFPAIVQFSLSGDSSSFQLSVLLADSSSFLIAQEYSWLALQTALVNASRPVALTDLLGDFPLSRLFSSSKPFGASMSGSQLFLSTFSDFGAPLPSLFLSWQPKISFTAIRVCPLFRYRALNGSSAMETLVDDFDRENAPLFCRTLPFNTWRLELSVYSIPYFDSIRFAVALRSERGHWLPFPDSTEEISKADWLLQVSSAAPSSVQYVFPSRCLSCRSRGFSSSFTFAASKNPLGRHSLMILIVFSPLESAPFRLCQPSVADCRTSLPPSKEFPQAAHFYQLNLLSFSSQLEFEDSNGTARTLGCSPGSQFLSDENEISTFATSFGHCSLCSNIAFSLGGQSPDCSICPPGQLRSSLGSSCTGLSKAAARESQILATAITLPVASLTIFLIVYCFSFFWHHGRSLEFSIRRRPWEFLSLLLPCLSATNAAIGSWLFFLFALSIEEFELRASERQYSYEAIRKAALAIAVMNCCLLPLYCSLRFYKTYHPAYRGNPKAAALLVARFIALPSLLFNDFPSLILQLIYTDIESSSLEPSAAFALAAASLSLIISVTGLIFLILTDEKGDDSLDMDTIGLYRYFLIYWQRFKNLLVRFQPLIASALDFIAAVLFICLFLFHPFLNNPDVPNTLILSSSSDSLLAGKISSCAVGNVFLSQPAQLIPMKLFNQRCPASLLAAVEVSCDSVACSFPEEQISVFYSCRLHRGFYGGTSYFCQHSDFSGPGEFSAFARIFFISWLSVESFCFFLFISALFIRSLTAPEPSKLFQMIFSLGIRNSLVFPLLMVFRFFSFLSCGPLFPYYSRCLAAIETFHRQEFQLGWLWKFQREFPFSEFRLSTAFPVMILRAASFHTPIFLIIYYYITLSSGDSFTEVSSVFPFLFFFWLASALFWSAGLFLSSAIHFSLKVLRNEKEFPLKIRPSQLEKIPLFSCLAAALEFLALLLYCRTLIDLTDFPLFSSVFPVVRQFFMSEYFVNCDLFNGLLVNLPALIPCRLEEILSHPTCRSTPLDEAYGNLLQTVTSDYSPYLINYGRPSNLDHLSTRCVVPYSSYLIVEYFPDESSQAAAEKAQFCLIFTVVLFCLKLMIFCFPWNFLGWLVFRHPWQIIRSFFDNSGEGRGVWLGPLGNSNSQCLAIPSLIIDYGITSWPALLLLFSLPLSSNASIVLLSAAVLNFFSLFFLLVWLVFFSSSINFLFRSSMENPSDDEKFQDSPEEFVGLPAPALPTRPKGKIIEITPTHALTKAKKNIDG